MTGVPAMTSALVAGETFFATNPVLAQLAEGAVVAMLL